MCDYHRQRSHMSVVCVLCVVCLSLAIWWVSLCGIWHCHASDSTPPFQRSPLTGACQLHCNYFSIFDKLNIALRRFGNATMRKGRDFSPISIYRLIFKEEEIQWMDALMQYNVWDLTFVFLGAKMTNE